MIGKKALFVAFLFLLPLLVWSQEIPLNLNFQKLGLEDGLTDNHYNNFVYQDSKGFTWISSIDGLNRFDGSNIKTYRSSSGMVGNNIQSNFFEDQESNIWFSTFEALNCYIRKADTIQAFPILDEFGDLINHDLKVFYLDHLKNRLWLRAGEYILGLDIKNPENYFALPIKTKGNHFSIQQNRDGTLKSILESPWINADSIAIRHINDSIQISHQNYLPNGFKNLIKSIPLYDSGWLFFANQSLFIFNENDPAQIHKLSNPIKATFRDATKLDKATLLISTKTKGLWHYNWKEETFLKQWANKKNQKSTLSSEEPREINLVRDQFLWISHHNQGLDYSPLFNNAFENPLRQLDLNKAEIVAILEDNQQRIWVGTKFNGIFLFSQTGNYLSHFKLSSKNGTPTEIWQISKANDQDFFITSKAGLYHIDNKTGVQQLVKNSEKLYLRFISFVYPNRILVSTNKGLKEVIKNGKGSYSIDDCAELSSYDSFSFLQLFQTSRKKVYLPYNANELWVFDANQEGLNPIKKLACNLEFFGFCESKKQAGTIWAGSSGGLVKIIQDTLIQTVFDENSALGKGNVYGLVEDDSGVLWITTNQGLWQYHPEQKSLFQYDRSDGLSGTLFSLYSSTLFASNGNIWLGNNQGLVKFNPKNISPYSVRPKVYIDQLTINDTDIKKGISSIKTLDLNYDENTFVFDIKAINYYKTEKNIIRYQLKGYDDEWLNIKNGQPIRYTKVPHGQYSFVVKAEDINGNTSDLKTLSIHISPPLWKTWWFYTLCALFLLTLVYTIYRYRIIQVKKNEEKKTAIAQLQLQVLEVEMKALRAQMNPHFLFNAMNSIKGIIVKKEEKKAAVYLTKFSALLRAILTNSEKQKIVLSKELEALKLYIELESLRFTKAFNYQIQVDKTIDTGFCRIPPLILQPFVENAIWHGLIPKAAGDNKLNINIFRQDEFVIFEVEDNGIGRKEATNYQKENGHQSLGISITRKRIELLHPENTIQIIDLVDHKEKALGTKVNIRLHLPE